MSPKTAPSQVPDRPSGISFTLDLEEHRAVQTGPPRYVPVILKLLDFLDGLGISGTVFVVGRVAEDSPDLIRAIAARGHEVGFHGMDHEPLEREGDRRFLENARTGRALLQDLSGQEVRGFRAPVFSLTARTPWAADALAEAGFAYSSSVLPAANPLHGFPGAPRTPFRWPSGVIELPVPVARLGPVTLPYLGGVYLRYLPFFLVRRLAQNTADGAHWTYCHPYDFDAEEPFARIHGTGLAVSILLWLRRGRTWTRLENLLAQGAAPPLGVRVQDGEFADAPMWRPPMWRSPAS